MKEPSLLLFYLLNPGTEMKHVLILVFLFSSLTLSSFRVAAPFVISKPITAKGLFDSDDVLEIKLKGKFRDLLNDRASKNTKVHSDNPLHKK